MNKRKALCHKIQSNNTRGFFSLQIIIIMLVNGKHFTASTATHDCLKRLCSSAGNCALLPELKPARYLFNTHIWRLLFNGFLCQGICCFLSGSFVLYTAGIFDTFIGASLFIAMSDSPLIRCIFQRGSDP
jgi:hypothetical protein